MAGKKLMKAEDFGVPIYPAAEPVELADGLTRVNLKRDVTINGVRYARGMDVEVPTDAYEVWKHALAEG